MTVIKLIRKKLIPFHSCPDGFFIYNNRLFVKRNSDIDLTFKELRSSPSYDNDGNVLELDAGLTIWTLEGTEKVMPVEEIEIKILR